MKEEVVDATEALLLLLAPSSEKSSMDAKALKVKSLVDLFLKCNS